MTRPSSYSNWRLRARNYSKHGLNFVSYPFGFHLFKQIRGFTRHRIAWEKRRSRVSSLPWLSVFNRLNRNHLTTFRLNSLVTAPLFNFNSNSLRWSFLFFNAFILKLPQHYQFIRHYATFLDKRNSANLSLFESTILIYYLITFGLKWGCSSIQLIGGLTGTAPLGLKTNLRDQNKR